MRLCVFFLTLIFATCANAVPYCMLQPRSHEVIYPCCGILRANDRKIDGLKWGNWGSRPYEYYWAAKAVSIKGKHVIDLGVGLPSQYDWWSYVVDVLKPAHYVGIDKDGRMSAEMTSGAGYELRLMDMTKLTHADEKFDVAYAIGVFASMEYGEFKEALSEIHRVLKKDGLLVFTLDERWDKDEEPTKHNSWNTLERTAIQRGKFKKGEAAFGLPALLDLIQDYFVLVDSDAQVQLKENRVRSKVNSVSYYMRSNRDSKLLHSEDIYNCCVSYAVVRKVER